MKKLVVIVYIILLTACGNQDDVSPNSDPEIFRIVIDGSYNTADSGDWLIVHDEAGKLLYSSRFESGDTLVAKSTLGPGVEKLTVTLFETKALPDRTFELRSYTNIPAGSQWVVAQPGSNFDYPQQQGSFTITAFNIPSSSKITASTRYGINAFFEPVPRVPYSYAGQFTRYSESPHLVWARDANDNMRYIFFDDVKAGDELSFSYEDLHIPEFTIEVNVEGYEDVYLGVSGLEAKKSGEWWGYDIGSPYSLDDRTTTIKIGYLDRLKFYRTNLRLARGFQMIEYEKVGDRPESIDFPDDVEVTFENKSLGSFSASLSVPFERRLSRWDYHPASSSFSIITWWVNSPEDGQTLQQLPQELLELFPTLQVEKLVHSSSIFVLSGHGYDHLIETTFKGKPSPDEYEFFRAIFW